jgi:hypothetical protein
MNRELLQQALDALRSASGAYLLPVAEQHKALAAIDALEAAIAQPEQEPDAWMHSFRGAGKRMSFPTIEETEPEVERGFSYLGNKPLYTSPPIVSLSDEEIVRAFDEDSGVGSLIEIARVVEAAMIKKAGQA